MMVGMDLGLAGHRALVTAASGGLGYATAAALAAEGATVSICSREAERAEQAAARIADDTGATVYAFAADVSRPADLERVFADATSAMGGLDVLVNNAGGPPPGGFASLTEADWARGFELTLMSAVRGVRLALPHFADAGGGSVCTILSSSVKQPIPNLLLSNVYRPALQGLTKSLAIELADQGVRVNGIAPGRIDTERVQALDRALAEKQGRSLEEVQAASLRTIPMGRLGRPAEFGRVAAFLCAPAASYVTGHVMIVDGGSVRAL
jgi:3-oxoacyl-[acyl-carrier protein] reductase